MNPDLIAAIDAHVTPEVATWGPIPDESRDRIAVITAPATEVAA